MGIIHTTVIIEEIAPARQFYYLSAKLPQAQPQAQPQPQALVTMARKKAPKKKILALRYTDTGAIVPLLDEKGAYVDADTKVMVWIPGMDAWVAGPGCSK